MKDVLVGILLDDLIGQDVKLHLHLSCLGKRGAKVEILEVECYKVCSWSEID